MSTVREQPLRHDPRDLISEQDEIGNKRRSKALHLLSVKQVVMEDGAVADIDKARREVARPDGLIVINPGMKFEITDGADLAEGQFKLLEHATGEMQASGPNASMSGTDPRELSGRAILAQQAGGSARPMSRSPIRCADVVASGLRSGHGWRRESIGAPAAGCA